MRGTTLRRSLAVVFYSVVLAAVVASPATADLPATGQRSMEGSHYDFASVYGGALTVSLSSEPSSPRAGDTVRWELGLTNNAQWGVTLTFPSSQLGDVVLEQWGVERYRWSAGRMFAQVIGERYLGPGETWTFTLEGSLDAVPGRYDAIATVAGQPAPEPTRVPVVVQAP